MSHVIYWMLYFKWKTECSYWYRRVVKVLAVHPRDHMADWALLLPCPASRGNIVLHIASSGNDQNSKFEIQFLPNSYHFCTIIKSKNHKLNHCKSGTICSYSFPAHLTKYLLGSNETTFNWRYFINCKALYVKCYKIINNKKRIILSTS